MNNFYIQNKFEPINIHNSMNEDGFAPIVYHYYKDDWYYGFCYEKFDSNYLVIVPICVDIKDLQDKYFESIEDIPDSIDINNTSSNFVYYKQYNSMWKQGVFKNNKWSYLKTLLTNQVFRIIKKL